MLNVGERFDFALKELKITNKEIAESFNISSQNVSNLKKNDRLNDLISQIATKYNINLNWLVTGKGNYLINNESINHFQNSNFNKAFDISSNSHSQDSINIGNNVICEKILKMNQTIVSSFINVYDKLEKKEDLKRLHKILGEIEFE